MRQLPAPSPNWCLFLDFDGTLVELQRYPEQVEAPSTLVGLLVDLLDALDGAVAIISGRSVANLEALLTPLTLPLAGVHGLERRDAHGLLHRYGDTGNGLEPVRSAVADFVAARDGLHWEDKGFALAVHFRDAPQRGGEVASFLAHACERLGAGYHIQAGKSVYELKPAGRDKSGVVSEFLAEPPFVGRVPVVLGDDITDEHAFAEVNRRGGITIRVGEPNADTRAQYHLASVSHALDWLRRIPAALVDDGRHPR